MISETLAGIMMLILAIIWIIYFNKISSEEHHNNQNIFIIINLIGIFLGILIFMNVDPSTITNSHSNQTEQNNCPKGTTLTNYDTITNTYYCKKQEIKTTTIILQ